MSILIKGMEMPKKGSWVSLRVFPGGQCFLYSWCWNDFDFMEHLDAAPVPPHGRLIDANVAYDKIAEAAGERSGNYVDMDVVDRGLSETPTVIEAEEET